MGCTDVICSARTKYKSRDSASTWAPAPKQRRACEFVALFFFTMDGFSLESTM
jgi:hypothetical protein